MSGARPAAMLSMCHRMTHPIVTFCTAGWVSASWMATVASPMFSNPPCTGTSASSISAGRHWTLARHARYVLGVRKQANAKGSEKEKDERQQMPPLYFEAVRCTARGADVEHVLSMIRVFVRPVVYKRRCGGRQEGHGGMRLSGRSLQSLRPLRWQHHLAY